MDEPLKVSVIIPIYNRAELLPELIRCLCQQSYPHKEIIFVDDGSTDDTWEILQKTEGVISLRQENSGPAAARNLGLSAASGVLIHFLDSDVYPPPQLLADHVRHHCRRQGLIVQGQVIRIYARSAAFHEPMRLVHYSRPFFATGNVSVEKKHVVSAGGFDAETFRKGWEDLDLGLRLRRQGLRVKRLYRRGFVWHLETDLRSLEDLKGYFDNKYHEGREAVRFYRKHPRLSVRLMTMSHPAFFLWNRVVYYKRDFESENFLNRIRQDLNNGRSARASGRIRFAATHYYLSGVEDRLGYQPDEYKDRTRGSYRHD